MTKRILIVHSAYQQRGGEDTVVEQEIALLRANGHEVRVYARDNEEIKTRTMAGVGRELLWSSRTVAEVEGVVQNFFPDVIHAHNTFPLVSPSLYWVASRLRVPVVQTLHNFRLLCPQAMFLRDGRVCEDCLGGFPWSAIRHRCYRGSVAQSGALATMLGVHRALGSFRDKVTRYIALNEFCRHKFIEGGFPEHKICVKPNFLQAPDVGNSVRSGGVFVGRLAAEKGISLLLRALDSLPTVTIDIVGDGPERAVATSHRATRCHGWLEREVVFGMMSSARYLVMPSLCYETFGLVAIEAFAHGLPVIASRLGAMAEAIDDGRTGLLFEAGSAPDLARVIAWAESHPDELRQMGINARREYEEKYTPEKNYRQLMAVYGDAIEAGRHEEHMQ
jgi:glycosyltransferase involved in cell wall biosynthesis